MIIMACLSFVKSAEQVSAILSPYVHNLEALTLVVQHEKKGQLENILF